METLRVDCVGRDADARYYAVWEVSEVGPLDKGRVLITVLKKLEGPRRTTLKEAVEDCRVIATGVEA